MTRTGCRFSTSCDCGQTTGTSFSTPYLIELNGKDLRRQPIEERKSVLAKLLRGAKLGLQLNEHLAEPGDVVRHACRLGLEGIVSKRLGSRYVSGRSRDWLKFKNPNAPTVKREAEEAWGKEK